jgi:hypothetical protein
LIFETQHISEDEEWTNATVLPAYGQKNMN